MSTMSRVIAQIRGRRVYRVAIGYAVGATLTLALARLLVGGLPLPGWWFPFMVGAVIAGFPVAAVLGWTDDVDGP